MSSVPTVIGLLWEIATARPVRRRERTRGGGGRGAPKLTDEQVRAIRKDTRMPEEVAQAYGISRNYALHVMRGDTHLWVK